MRTRTKPSARSSASRSTCSPLRDLTTGANSMIRMRFQLRDAVAAFGTGKFVRENDLSSIGLVHEGDLSNPVADVERRFEEWLKRTSQRISDLERREMDR